METEDLSRNNWQELILKILFLSKSIFRKQLIPIIPKWSTIVEIAHPISSMQSIQQVMI